MKSLLSLCSLIVFTSACATTRGPMAMAMFEPSQGMPVRGMVHFQELKDGSVEVQVDLTGVPPGPHGFHVHESGACGTPSPHFNPTNMPHAGPDAVSHHAGDFGNLTAGPEGEVHTRFITRSVTVREGARSVVGRTVALHARADDLMTQPSGNSGDPIACAVITPMAESMHH